MYTHVYIIHVCVYIEDRYTTQTILKPSRRFYKWLAGPIWYTTFTPARFKTQSCSLLDRPGPVLNAVATEPLPVPNVLP